MIIKVQIIYLKTMKSLNTRFNFNLFLLGLSITIFTACGGDVQEIEDIPQDEIMVTEKTNLFKIDNKLFQLPNPVQTGMMMKKMAVTYNNEFLSPISNLENYSTSFKQAVNIGVYGADLGYITANNKNQEALTHLGAIKKLSESLDVSSSFDFGELEKFGSNIGDKEKMLGIITKAYKSCEKFLKDEERHDLAGLIMAGVLVEGLHFTVSLTKSENKQDAIEQLGVQKHSLDNIILVLNPHYSRENAPELSDFVDRLVDLQAAFGSLNSKYSFKESTIDEANKTCTINSVSTYKLSDKSLEIITNKIAKIRTLLIS